MEPMIKRVERGAAWLTAEFGSQDWVARIDLDALDIESYDHCVLGQLFGNALNAPLPRIDWAAYGFDIFWHPGLMFLEREAVHELTSLWVDLVKRLREPGVPA